MATTSTTTFRFENQPRRINLRYIAEMSFLSSLTFTSDDITQPHNSTSTSTSTKENKVVHTTKSKPVKKGGFDTQGEEELRSPKCWSWFTDYKDFDGIIETNKPFPRRHEHYGSSKNPLLCIVKLHNLKKVTKKIALKKKTIESYRENCSLPTIDQAKPILSEKDNESDDQEADYINPQNIDAFIREEDASWNENLSVVEMHEWLPTKPVFLQLLTSDSDSVKRSFDDDASLASFDLEAFNSNNFSDNNVFRQSGFEIIRTPSTAPDTSFFSEGDSKDNGGGEDSSASERKNLPSIEKNTTAEDARADVQELLNITQSNSFDTVEFYEEEEEGVAVDSDAASAYFSSDNLTQVHPHIVSSVSPSVASSIRGSEADELLSIPSFPSSSSWDGDDDEEEDQFIFGDQGVENADRDDKEGLNGIATTEAAYFSCFKFGGFLTLMI